MVIRDMRKQSYLLAACDISIVFERMHSAKLELTEAAGNTRIPVQRGPCCRHYG